MQSIQKVIIFDPHSGNMLTTYVDNVLNWSIKSDQCGDISIMDHNKEYDFTHTKQIGSVYLSKGIFSVSDTSVEYSHSTCKFVPSTEGTLYHEGIICKNEEILIYVWIIYAQEDPIEILLSSSPIAIRRRILLKKIQAIDDNTLIQIEKATDAIVKPVDASNIISLDMFDN